LFPIVLRKRFKAAKEIACSQGEKLGQGLAKDWAVTVCLGQNAYIGCSAKKNRDDLNRSFLGRDGSYSLFDSRGESNDASVFREEESRSPECPKRAMEIFKTKAESQQTD